VLSNQVIGGTETNVNTRLSTQSWYASLSLSWIGQMIASGCWIASVFAYGISSVGDVMQLVAASAWMVANIAALFESPK
jgi:hydroxyethylthiazole kinase-like sugar kinase family protein